MRYKRQKIWFFILAFAGSVLTPFPLLAGSLNSLSPEATRQDEIKYYDYLFSDGVRLKVHYQDRVLKKYGAGVVLASQVLDAAVSAYQTITQFEGFNTPGYSFNSANPRYAYDPDKTIDIYLGDPNADNSFVELGSKNRLFRDAPCFDTIHQSGARYQAVILLPANYREFIKNWEKVNPSPLGKRNLNVDLRGTLMHEMLHAVIFYYNKNLNKSKEASPSVAGSGPRERNAQELDWYVEGLARYFETFGGARHDFFSQGFKETLVDKIRFSRGGSNYFMRYPDQPFTRLRYENALFWRFMDERYGMSAIEKLSRVLRDPSIGFKQALEEVTEDPLVHLLKSFALSALQKDFGLKDDTEFLNEVARTRLRYENNGFYLLDGNGNKKLLGGTCATDWIGRWEDVRSGFDRPSIAGDATPLADVSGWATDYFEITLDESSPALPVFQVRNNGEGAPLYLQIICVSQGGSSINIERGPLGKGRSQRIDLPQLAAQNGLRAKEVARIYLLVTNADPQVTATYQIRLEGGA